MKEESKPSVTIVLGLKIPISPLQDRRLVVLQSTLKSVGFESLL